MDGLKKKREKRRERRRERGISHLSPMRPFCSQPILSPPFQPEPVPSAVDGASAQLVLIDQVSGLLAVSFTRVCYRVCFTNLQLIR